MSETAYAVTVTPAKEFNRLSLSQFLLMFTYFCQPKEVPAMKIIQMHRLLKEKGKLTLSMTYLDMVSFRNNVENFAPCLAPKKVETFLTIQESKLETEADDLSNDSGLEQYLKAQT